MELAGVQRCYPKAMPPSLKKIRK